MYRRHFIAQSAGAVALGLLAQTAIAQDTPAAEPNAQQKVMGIHVKLTSIWVADQAVGLKFYTEILGFQLKRDIPAGGARWLTVVSPHDPDGAELLLEPLGLAPAKTFQKAIYDMGIPFTALIVDDVQKEYDRLVALGVKFRMKPMKMGFATMCHFEDTCGNLIQLMQAEESK